MSPVDTTPAPNPRDINTEDLADGDLLRYDATDEEWKRVTFAQLLADVAQTAPSVPGSIAAATTDTSAAMLTDVQTLRTSLASLVTKLTTAGVLK